MISQPIKLQIVLLAGEWQQRGQTQLDLATLLPSLDACKVGTNDRCALLRHFHERGLLDEVDLVRLEEQFEAIQSGHESAWEDDSWDPQVRNLLSDRPVTEATTARSLDPHATSFEEQDPNATELQSTSCPTDTQDVAPDSAPAGNAIPHAPGRYQEMRFHARGGLGQIHVALDKELNREVALKQIRPQFAQDDSNRERFVMEGEVTGRLEHPGVVPVYGMGTGQDGPFYAMRFIKGNRLTDAIAAYHHSERSERRIERQQLLRRFISICETLDYAHSRGVLHRDLKPDNIMLGPYGETLVVDWGLAKIFQRTPSARSESVEETLQPQQGIHPGSTIRGSIAGTLLYMSPEQAMGWHDRLRPPSDIFSLGAILFEVLTGRALYEADNLNDAQRLAVECNAPAPRAVDPTIEKPLDAICRKATHKDESVRYQTAGELAADVDAFLADEPVSAANENWLERTGRWARKNRTLVSTATAAGLLIIAGLAGMSGILSIKNLEIAQKNDEITKQRDQATNNLDLARQAVRDLLDTLSSDKRLQEPGLDQLRLELAQSARPYYVEFLSENPDSVELREEQAKLLANLGLINYQAGSRKDASEQFAAQRRILESLLADAPSNQKYWNQLAQTMSRMATLAFDDGRWEESIDLYRKAAELAKKLSGGEWKRNGSAEDAAGLGAFAELAPRDLLQIAETGVGSALLEIGQLKRAEEAFQAALDLTRIPVPNRSDANQNNGEFDSDGDVRGNDNELADKTWKPHPKILSSILNLAKVRYLLGHISLAEKTYQLAFRSIPMVEQSLAQEVDLLVFEAGLYGEYGVFLMDCGFHLRSQAAFEKAYKLAVVVAEKYPQNLIAKDVVAYAKNNLTVPLQAIAPRDRDQGELLLEQRQRLLESLAENETQLDLNPSIITTRINLCVNLKNLAGLAFQQSDSVQALEHLEQAKQALEVILQEHPQSMFAKQQMVWTLLSLADVTSVDAERRREAQTYVELALQRSESAWRETQAIVFAIASLNGYSRLAWFAEEPEAAIETLGRSLRLVRSLPPNLQSLPTIAQNQSVTYEAMSQRKYAAGRLSESNQLLANAVQTNDQIATRFPKEPAYQMRRYMLGLAQALRAMETEGENYSPQMQELVGKNVSYIQNMDPKWIRTDILKVAVQALETLADYAATQEAYSEQWKKLDLSVRMQQELWDRTQEKRQLLQLARLHLKFGQVSLFLEQADVGQASLRSAQTISHEYLAIQPRSRTAKQVLAEAHIQFGAHLAGNSNHADAIKEFELAAELDSNARSKAQLQHALSQAHLGRPLSAVEEALSVSENEVLDAEGLYNVASVLAVAYLNSPTEQGEALDDNLTSGLRPGLKQKIWQFLDLAFDAAGADASAFFEFLQEDDDFDPLRESPEYIQLIQRYIPEKSGEPQTSTPGAP